MAYISMAAKGARRYIKKRKNLTIILTGSFFMLSFFLILFSSTSYYLGSYWGGHMLGYELINKRGSDVSFFSPPAKEDLFDYKSIAPVLDKNNITASPRLRFGAMLELDDINQQDQDLLSRYPVMLIGVEPDKEPLVLDGIKLLKGRWPSGPGEIAVYDMLYYQLDSKSLSFSQDTDKQQENTEPELILYTSTVDGYLNYDLVKVVGVFTSTNLQFFYASNMIGFVDKKYAASLIDVSADKCSDIVTPRLSFISRIKLSLSLTEDYQLTDFWKAEDIPYTFYWFYRFISVLIFLLILGVVFTTVSHNIRLVIAARMREIGVYLSMGASSSWVIGLFMLEMLVYTIYCSVLGGLLNYILMSLLNRAGIYAINAPMELFLGTGEFYFIFNIGQYLTSYLILGLVTLLAAFRPLVKGVKRADIVSLFRQ